MATKDFSSKQEKAIAEYLDWAVVAGSGAAACYPGDVISDDWLGECKTHITPNQKLFFSYTVWNKIQQEAIAKHRYPVLITDTGTQRLKDTWCLFSVTALDRTKAKLHPVNKYVSTNITIPQDAIQSIYFNLSSSDNEFQLASFDWKGKTVIVCTIAQFKDILEKGQ